MRKCLAGLAQRLSERREIARARDIGITALARKAARY